MLVSKYDLYRDLYEHSYKIALRKRAYYIDKVDKERWAPLSYQNEHMTVSIDMGRVTGKTKFIIDKLLENPKAIVVVIKEVHVREMIKIEPRIKDQVFSASGFVNRFYSRGMSEHVILGRGIPELEVVFLDEPRFFCTREQRNYTNRGHCTYFYGTEKHTLEDLIQYAAYKTGAVTIMVGMK